MVHALFLLVAVLVDFFFSRSSKSQKKSVAKNWVCLTSERSLEVKNMKKQENLLRSVKIK
jgi:hypothetical protein